MSNVRLRASISVRRDASAFWDSRLRDLREVTRVSRSVVRCVRVWWSWARRSERVSGGGGVLDGGG